MSNANVNTGGSRSHRRPTEPRADVARRDVFHHRLHFEPLEDRRLLSVGICGRAWSDLDSNGIQGAGEPGVAGAVVELFSSTNSTFGDADDVSRGIAMTDSDGNYAFTSLPDELAYYEVFRAPVGCTAFTVKDSPGSTDTDDSDANAAGITALFTVSAGGIDATRDAGLVGTAPDFGFALVPRITTTGADVIPPTITDTTPSLTGGTVESGTQILGVRFNGAVLGAGTAANYELRAAGADGLLGTVDDLIQPLTVCYQDTVATLCALPLPEDICRLTVRDTITDPGGNKLDGNGDGVQGGDWVRDFVATPSSRLFSGTPNYATGGTGPRDVATGDFNGDNISDMVVANDVSNTLGVLLANGSGGFATATTFSCGGLAPVDVATGDFNRDGKADLVVVNSNSGTVGVLLGDGCGGFAAATAYSTGGWNPCDVAVGDFNGDDESDLAVANFGSSSIEVLLGNGNGEFAAAGVFSTGGSGPQSIALGDFNADGRTDIVVTNNSNTVGILLGNGAGAFTVATTLSVDAYFLRSVAVGDFNGDGKADLLLGQINSGYNTQCLGVFLGDGGGAFGALTAFYCGGSITSFAAGDFNGDGKADLAVSNEDGVCSVEVLLGDGFGGFAGPTRFSGGGAPLNSIAVGDFNGDGKSDLAATLSLSDNVGVLLGKGDGSFAATTTVPCGGTPYALATADFNSDGKADLAVANHSNIGILLGNGGGGFLSTTTVDGSGGVLSVTTGDFNSDGNVDLVASNGHSGTLSVLLGRGNGEFDSATKYPAGGTCRYLSCVVVGDFNGDSRSDLAVVNQDSNTVGVLLGTGTGSFGPTATFSSGGTAPCSVAIGDFNRDGNSDLAVSNENGTVGILLGNGSGSFTVATVLPVGTSSWSSIVAGDVNRDGKADLVVSSYAANYVGLLLGNGDGGFVSAKMLTFSGSGAFSVAMGDYNGDANTDLAISSNLNTVEVLLGDGSGVFGTPLVFSTGFVNTYSVVAGDFNDDGRTDLAVGNQSDFSVALLLNIYGCQGTSLTSPSGVAFDIATGNFGSGELIQGTNNAFDGDGRLMVGGKPYHPTLLNSTLADGGRTVVTGSGTISGLTVNRKITVPSTGSQDFARTIDSFTNSTGSPITTTVTIVGNLGSDAATNVFATSDGDAIVEACDQWIGTDDADGTSSPAVIHYIHGPAGLLPTSVRVVGDNIEWTYDLTVAAGETVRLGYFTIVAIAQADAVAMADTLVTPAGFGGQAAAFMSDSELASLQNFQFYPVATTTTVVASPNPSIYGQSVTFTATVSASMPSESTPTGVVTFRDGATVLGTSPLDASGHTTFTVSVLTAGLHTITASYGGDADFTVSTSPSATQAVDPAPLLIAANNQTKVYGDDIPTLTYCVSGLLGSDALTAQPMVSTTATADSPVGSYSIMVSGASAGDNYTITYVDGTLTVVPAPIITSTTPSLAGGTLTAGATTLAISFNVPVVGAGTAANYELRSLGPDGLLGTPDDAVFPLTASYHGTTAVLVFAPLMENVYRLTVHDTVTDVAGNPLRGNGSDGLGDWSSDFVATPSTAVLYAPSPYFAGGYNPQSIAVADFNGDGIPDVAAGVEQVGSVAIMLGDGTGRLSAATHYSSGGSRPYSIATGDFNGDGKVDLVLTNYASSTVGILTGDGMGRFSAAKTYSCGGTNPRWVAVADLNGDGVLDLATANYGSQTIGILLGNDNGTFVNATTFGVSGSPETLAIADLNGDHCLDLAVACAKNNTVGVFLNAGNGSFILAGTYASGGQPPSGLSVGDFNGDAKPDLVVVNNDRGVVRLLLNNGSGSFILQTPVNLASELGGSITVGDFNGDGNLDVAATASMKIAILWGDGAGTISTPTMFFSPVPTPWGMAATDLNGDGNLDIVLGSANSKTVGILLADGNGGYAPPDSSDYDSGGIRPQGLVTADFDNDGKLDLAVANWLSNTVAILSGNGDGTFAAADTYDTGGTRTRFLAVGDFNHDGNSDLVVTNYDQGTVGVLLGDGQGHLAPFVVYATGLSNPTRIEAADLNGDGNLDLVVLDGTYNSKLTAVLLGDGTGAFSTPRTFSTGGTNPFGVAIGDLNGDGELDLVVANNGNNGALHGTLGILLGDRAGGFSPVVTMDAGGNGLYGITAGDFNKDGALDLALVVAGTKVGLLFGNGHGSFSNSLPVFYASIANASSIVAADFNGDKNLDLAVAGGNNSVGMLLGDGAGGFLPVITNSLNGQGPNNITAGDFNGDGKLDLAEANSGSNTVGILLNVGGPAPTTLNSPNNLPFDIAVGMFGTGQLIQGASNAFDGDGRLMVGGTPFQPATTSYTMADGGRTVVTGSGTISSLTVNRKITVPSTGSEDFARTIDSFTNSTGSPITTTVTIVGNLGSDAATNVFATSDGDAIVETSDLWIGTDDADGTGSPAVIHYLHGPAGLRPASVRVVGDNIEWTYDLTVAAGETVRLGYFTIVATTQAAAMAAANAVVTHTGFSGEGGVFLTAPELASLQNFQFYPVATTTTVVASSNPSIYGQSVTFTATVSASMSSESTPTGMVTFMDGAAVLGTSPLDANGHTTITISVLTAGLHTITASYGGDADFTVSTSPSATQAVDPAPLLIAANNQTKVYGDDIPTLTVTYAGFVNSDTSAGLATQPIITTTATTASDAGSYAIEASGAVNPNYAISYASGTLSVTPALLTITAGNKTKVYGDPLPALTVAYTGFVNGDTISSLTIQPALATSATAGSPAADYPITVSGAVDPNYTIIYVNGTLHVLPSSTTVSIVSSISPSVYGQPVTFTATVVAANGTAIPTGTVVFSDGGVVFSTIALVQGQAFVTTSALAGGNHAIAASYMGNANFQDSNSALTQIVQMVAIEPDPLNPRLFTLAVGGTAGNDYIDIDYKSRGNQILVELSKPFPFRGSYDASRLAHVAAFGGSGNDYLRVGQSVTLPTTLFGGDGNDCLEAGKGPCVLVGGGGNDILWGGKGRSLLVGGLGNDALLGRGGDDIMIGGTTDYDTNLKALDLLLAEWNRTEVNYATRINHLLGPSGGGNSSGLNSPFFLNRTTVHDDKAVDLLMGGEGLDWFFDTPGVRGDLIRGRKSNERITILQGVIMPILW